MLPEGLIEWLARNWWLFALRGAAAIAFGVLALVWPGVTVTVLVFIFGVYALVDGIGSLLAAWRHRGDSVHRGHHLAEGLLALLIGVIALVWPGITALALIVLIALWALTTGIVEISLAGPATQGHHQRVVAGALRGPLDPGRDHSSRQAGSGGAGHRHRDRHLRDLVRGRVDRLRAAIAAPVSGHGASLARQRRVASVP